MEWKNEPYKIRLTFDNKKIYEVESKYAGNDKYICSAIKDSTEQVNYTNIFGSISSNSFEVTIYDDKNYLDIENKKSPYYNYMRVGVKVEAFISYDKKASWSPYGTFYVTDWSNMYSNGSHDVVTIRAVDEMKYILNNDIPKLANYAGIRADELITRVLVGVGVSKDRIKIDNSLDTKLLFGVTEDQKVGYFLNDICQALCAVIIINDSNEILVMPALVGYNKQYVLGKSCIEQVVNKNNNKNIYTSVKCRYQKRKGKRNGAIMYDTLEIEAGNNKLNNLKFGMKALNIRELRFESDNNQLYMNGFSAYQNGIDINLASISNIEDVDITVSGEYITSIERYVESKINYSDHSENTRRVSYEMYNSYVQTEAEAQIIADKMARYIELNNRQITIKTVLSPKITVGDILTFDNNLLQGKYKVIADRVVLGAGYQKVLTIIPYNLLGVWDDSKSWNDDTNWIENIDLSLT